jgi:hypothetical protein
MSLLLLALLLVGVLILLLALSISMLLLALGVSVLLLQLSVACWLRVATGTFSWHSIKGLVGSWGGGRQCHTVHGHIAAAFLRPANALLPAIGCKNGRHTVSSVISKCFWRQYAPGSCEYDVAWRWASTLVLAST